MLATYCQQPSSEFEAESLLPTSDFLRRINFTDDFLGGENVQEHGNFVVMAIHNRM
jgi:hypothetical protein